MFSLTSVTSSGWFVLLVLALGLGALWLLWRWSRSSPGRRRFWEGVSIVFVCANWLRFSLSDQQPSAGRKVLLVIGWTCFLLWIAFLLRELWRWRRSPSAQSPKEPPSLHRQLALILLPVCGLAVGGVILLARDRAAVEDDARRQAGEVARELAAKLGRSLPGELGAIQRTGDRWIGRGVSTDETLGDDPSTPPAPLRFAGLTDVAWRSRYPFEPSEVLPLEIRLGVDGSLLDPPGYPAVPQPNPWSQRLSGPALEAWQQLLEAETIGDSQARLDEATRVLSQATSDLALSYQLTFLELRRGAGTPSAELLGRLLNFARSAAQRRIEAESGVPIGVVALAEALRRTPEARLFRDWSEPLRELTLNQPSSLTPWLLDRGDELARRSDDPGKRVWLLELRARWNGTERLRKLADALKRSVALPTGTITNLWLEHAGVAWFTVVQPATSGAEASGPERGVTDDPPAHAVRFLREDLLVLAVHHAVETATILNGVEQRSRPWLPAGLKLGVACEGRPLPLPPSSWAAAGGERSSRVLAEAAGEVRPPVASFAPDANAAAWPARSRFTVQIYLADAAALFAAQRRQQWLFGGMIFITAGVAGFGVWQTHCAFRRQLALNEEKSNFVASVSHELRTPLASLRLLAEGLASGRVQDEARRREYAAFLVQEARRLGSLVENVLDFARIEQGRKRYQLEPTDLTRLAAATVKLMEPLAAERQVRLQLNLPAGSAETAGSVEIQGDGPALQQALVNLVDNALKHAPADSTVTVTLERSVAPGSGIRLSVSDAGPGIPAEDRERVFERFYRRGSELRRETQGVGLGLAIVRHVVDGHGGRVWVEGEPAHGAKFVMELPGKVGDDRPVGHDQ